MLKLLFLGLLVWILVSILKKKWGQASKQPTQSNTSERVVPCHHCGIHIPESSALKAGQLHFCSQQHLEQHSNQHD